MVRQLQRNHWQAESRFITAHQPIEKWKKHFDSIDMLIEFSIAMTLAIEERERNDKHRAINQILLQHIQITLRKFSENNLHFNYSRWNSFWDLLHGAWNLSPFVQINKHRQHCAKSWCVPTVTMETVGNIEPWKFKIQNSKWINQNTPREQTHSQRVESMNGKDEPHTTWQHVKLLQLTYNFIYSNDKFHV